jgi:hypothetical protein
MIEAWTRTGIRCFKNEADLAAYQQRDRERTKMERHHMAIVLLIIAFGCFLLAAFGIENIGRVKLVALGLMFLTAAMLVGPITLLAVR